MIPTVRVYETEQRAQEAVDHVVGEGFHPDIVSLVKPETGDVAAFVKRMVQEGQLPGDHTTYLERAFERGLFAVYVQAPLGRVEPIRRMLEAHDPADNGPIPKYTRDNPAPFSDTFGIPTLWTGRSSATLVRSRSAQHVTDPTISRSAAPLSSLFGIPTLSGAKPPWKSSLGLPLLSRNPTPLSSAVGLKTLSGKKPPWTSSFGLPLLSRNPAPLSSLFGLPLLTKRRKSE